MEEDGTITLLGRGSACINTGGEKVFPEEVEEADTIVQVDGSTRCVIDPKSLMFLYGMVCDYSDALIGGGFSFNNPNAESSCGCGKRCGESFGPGAPGRARCAASGPPATTTRCRQRAAPMTTSGGARRSRRPRRAASAAAPRGSQANRTPGRLDLRRWAYHRAVLGASLTTPA